MKRLLPLVLSLLASTALTSPAPAAEKEVTDLLNRADIKSLPAPLKNRLAQLIELPHAFPAVPAFNEATKPSLLFQYYLLDQTSFQPNVFTAQIKGINDTATPPDSGALGAIRVVLEPKPGKPLDPNNVKAAIDTFADFAGLNVIKNESGWYENWMIHDMVVAKVANPVGGRAQFGTITSADAVALKKMGGGNNVPGKLFTNDGNAPRFPSVRDHFPDRQSNLVWFAVSVGTLNGLQVNDAHAYIGNSIRARTGCSRLTSSRSRAASTTASKRARSAPSTRWFRGRGPTARPIARSNSATIQTTHATLTAPTPRLRRRTRPACVSSRAGWPTRSFWTPMRALPPSNRA
jgi:hypothetical protein